MSPTRLLATAFLVFVSVGCTGGDGDGDRAAAAEWCRITTELDRAFDSRNRSGPTDAQITYDRAAEWVDSSPEDIRPATNRAAGILRQLPTDPPHPELADARVDIAEYAEQNCEEPTSCFADVERNPKFPCLN